MWVGGWSTPGREVGCSRLPLQRREARAESASAKVDGFSLEFCSSEEGGQRANTAPSPTLAVLSLRRCIHSQHF